MPPSNSVYKKRYLLVILLVLSLLGSLIWVFLSDSSTNFPKDLSNFVTRFTENEVSEVTAHSEIQVKNDTVTKNITSSWLDYRNNWDGEILVINHPNETKLTLTDNYRLKMRSKGLHPLNLKYKRLRDRMERIDKYCNISLSGNDSEYNIIGYYSMFFHDKSQLIQCLVQKVGSSYWVKVFSQISGIEIQLPYDPNDELWQTMSITYNIVDSNLTAQRFQTYTKFMFSRQPFQRLLSAHRGKFHNNQSRYEETFAPQIITANYLSNYSEEFILETRRKLKNGTIRNPSSEVVHQIARLDAGFQKFDITILEFLKFVIFSARTSGASNLDPHWKPISLLCNPCAIKYDVIGRFETLSEDSQAILDFVHPNIPEFQYEFRKGKPHFTSSNCDEAFRKIPLEVRRSLYEIFKEDYLLFDYEYNEDESANLC